ncbi:MAG: hypothetical protein Phog2KO_05150 [Phototrophicaceae bacterium]
MSKFDIDWGNSEASLLIVTFNTGWNFQDYSECVKELRTIALSKGYTLHLFPDLQMTKSVPDDILIMMKSIENFMVDNIDFIVLISPSSVWTKLYRSFQHLLPPEITIEFASNTDRAYQILHNKAF